MKISAKILWPLLIALLITVYTITVAAQNKVDEAQDKAIDTQASLIEAFRGEIRDLTGAVGEVQGGVEAIKTYFRIKDE